MKKIVIALTAVAAMTGSALAADMAPRAYTKAAPMVAPVANWKSPEGVLVRFEIVW